MTDYIRTLRQSVGRAPILQCGASVILENPAGELLLQLRRDNRMWGFSGGAIELDEPVEHAARRELFEETGLTARSLTLFDVFSGPELHYVYPNGDEVSNIDIVFLCRDYEGTLLPQHSEVLELGFYPPDNLPAPFFPLQERLVRAYLARRKDFIM